jgi:hypothetical protein
MCENIYLLVLHVLVFAIFMAGNKKNYCGSNSCNVQAQWLAQLVKDQAAAFVSRV